MVCVGLKITEFRGVASSAGHLLDHMNAVAVLLKQRGGFSQYQPPTNPPWTST
jgi:hypothetical protein